MIDQAIRQSAAYGTSTLLSRASLLVALLVLPFILPVRWMLVAVAGGAGAAIGAIGHGTAYPDPVTALLLKAVLVIVAAALVVLIGLVPFRATLDYVSGFAASRRPGPTGR